MALRTEARKPLYAVVGAGDLAVENIKDLPADLIAQATQLVPKTTALVADLPGKVQGLRGEVETRATALTGKAFTTYGELVERGQKLVGTIRRTPATPPAQAPVKAAKASAKKTS